MREPHKTKPKLTDAARYQRFLDTAEKAGASDRPEDLDTALRLVIRERPIRQSEDSTNLRRKDES